MLVSWAITPYEHGAPVTAYRVKFMASGGSFQAIASCDGTTTSVISSLSCAVPMSALTSAPLTLALGASVKVEVEALNS